MIKVKSETAKIIDTFIQENKDYMRWVDIKNSLNTRFNFNFSETWYRKGYYLRHLDAENQIQMFDDSEFEEEKEKIKARDYANQAREYVRRISREETLKEIASDVSSKMFSKYPLLKMTPASNIPVEHNEKAAILQLSDWHYGIDIDNYWNVYNTEIFEKRLSDLTVAVIDFLLSHHVTDLRVVNLGDLISGRIHAQIRMQNRVDVITQTMCVSEYLCEFINIIAEKLPSVSIKYYDCLDNHSRVEPDKTKSLDLESFVALIPWYMAERLKDLSNFEIVQNTYSYDIIDMTVCGHRIAGVHGHLDHPSKVVDNLTTMTKDPFEMILTAHNHHFLADEKNECIVMGNGSLMGTDGYAAKYRLTSKPSQNIILVTPENVTEDIKRIVLE